MIKIGLIGCGVVTQKAHVPALIRDPRFTISSFCRRDKNKLVNLQNQFPETTSYTDFRLMMDAELLDCVLIATDVDNHLEIAEYALQKKLYVLLEKPVSSNSNDIKAFIKKHSSSLNRILVGFNKRFYPSINKLSSYIKEGQLSKPIGGTISFATQQGGKLGKAGILQNLIHTCDLVCHIFGNPVEVKTNFSKALNDDREGKTINSTILTETGSSVGLFFTSSSNWKLFSHERIEIFDDNKGKVLIEDCDKIYLSRLDKTQPSDNWGNYPVINEYSKQSNSIFYRDSSFGYEQQISSFGDLVQGKLDTHYPDLESALNAQILFESIFSSE